jgi:hypothetical protein
MNGVLAGLLATHHALLSVPFHTGDFEEAMQVVNLFLLGAFLADRCAAGQPVFFLGGFFFGW